MKGLKKITKWVVDIFTVILLIILVLVIYGKCVMTFSNNTFPNYFGWTFFEVASGSMEPTLSVSDVIVVKVTNENIKKKDIVSYFNGNSIITHRVVFIDNDVITLKGDDNNTIDEPINKSQIIGKVTKVLPKFGIWKKVITEPKILAVLFVTLLICDFALSYKGSPKDLIKELKGSKKKNEEKAKPLVAILPKKDTVSEDKLLDVTRIIDIKEIKDLIENKELNCNNVRNLQVNKQKLDDLVVPELKKKQRILSDYTLRLDLRGIQRRIDSNVK